MGILDGRDQLPHVGLQLGDRADRPVEHQIGVVLVRLRAADGLHDQPPAVRRVDRERAHDVDHLAAATHRARGGDAVEHDRGKDPGAVPERELEVLLALAPSADVDSAQQEHPCDPASFPKLSNLHDRGRR